MRQLRYPKLALIAAIGMASHSAFAGDSDGTIIFKGEIVDTVCSLAPESQNLNVPLGKVSKASLTAKGVKSTPAVFHIHLVNCGATAKGAKVTFTGSTDPAETGALRVGVGEMDGTYAQGVAVELQNSAGQKIALGTPSGNYSLSAGDNSLTFKAVYIATADNKDIKTGPANSTAQFTLAYN